MSSCQLKFSFSGHETFVFRYGWLKKAVDAIFDDPKTFNGDEAIVTLGLGKNMVKSLRHWSLATRMLEEEGKKNGGALRPTDLGMFLLGPQGADPYLEDPNTLWILHWNLLSNRDRCTTWFWVFNLISSNEFTRDGLADSLVEEARRCGATLPSDISLKRDIDVFLRTYISRSSHITVQEDSLDCPLAELELIEEVPGGQSYQIRRGPKESLSDSVFAYALADFWDRSAPSQNSLAFTDIAYAQGSPGNAFKLDENSLISRLEHLEHCTAGEMFYTETAGLKQVLRKRTPSPFSFLEPYYQATNPLLEVGV